MITEAIRKVTDGAHLTIDEAAETMEEIMEGKATDAQIAALITGLRMKGETVAEISGFAQVMRQKATRLHPKAKVVVDTCGTGGDATKTFNISTTTAFVVAGAGVAVAKHGNRAVSSSCGSADVLETLGVRIDIPAERVGKAIDEVGIGFMFAPMLHPAMKYAVGPRKEIGIRTVFNILGPLTNPAGADRQVLGVYEPQLTQSLAGVLRILGSTHALVVHGDGLDELTTTGESKVCELKDGEVETYPLDPTCLDLKLVSKNDLAGGSLQENADITRSVLLGKEGPARDVVLLNAAAALLAADKVNSLKQGIEVSAQSIDSGAAKSRLDELITFTNS